MGKHFTSSLVTLFLLISSTFPAAADSAPKPGTKCAKAGHTQVAGNKKFTCIKSGSKLTWNKGVTVTAKAKATPSASASGESSSTVKPTSSASASSSPASALVKFKNCNEVKAAGAAPLTKTKNPELYELNASLDRDKDGIACES